MSSQPSTSGADPQARLGLDGQVLRDELFQLVFAHSLDGVAVLNAADGTYCLQNEAHEVLTGYSDAELKGQTPAIHLHEEDLGPVLEALASAGTFRGDVRSRHKSGLQRWVDLSAFTVRDEQGAPLYYVGIKRDATLRRRGEHEDRLRETANSLSRWARPGMDLNEQLQGVLMELLLVPWLDLSPRGAVFLTEAEGDPGRLSRVAATNFDPAVQELHWGLGDRRARSLKGKDAAPAAVHVPLERGGERLGLLLVEPRGRVRSLEPSPALLALGATIAGMIESTRARHALEETQELFQELATSLPGAVYQYELHPDGSHAFPFASNAIESLMGLTAAEVMRDAGLPFQRVHPEDLESLQESIRRSAETLGTWSFEYRYLHPNGATQWHRGVSNPRRLDSGVTRWIGVLMDVTPSRRAEQELRKAKEAAEAAARAKSRFLASVSHELRTPMNAVIGMSELLLETPLGDSQQEYAQTIRASADNLLLLIDDLLDVNRMGSEDLELEVEPFDLRSVVEDALTQVAGRAAKKGLSLSSLFADDVPGRAAGDPARLRQVLVNLLSNAVKYTAEGEVEVTVSLASSLGDEQDVLRFAVRDTGTGIPPERMHLLFEPFRQLSSERQEAGTGLGLAICKGLVTLMGGKIWAESKPGFGSTFRFTYPVERAPARPTSTARLSVLERDVSIVASAKGERRMLTQQCERWGLRVRSASTVAGLGAHSPDPAEVLFVDATAEALEELRESARDLPVVLLLAVGQSAPPPEFCEALGVVGQLHKPVRAAPLLNVLTNVFGKESPPPAQSPQRELSRELPLRVLVVEDHQVNRRVATHMLARLGYDADTAGDGLEALRCLERAPYDLVLMDVQMPRLDGLETTRRVRETMRLGPKIVALTASASSEDRRRCLDAGVDAYLSKPVRLKSLQDTLISLFRHPTPVDESFDRLRQTLGDAHFDELIGVTLEEVPELMGHALEAPSAAVRLKAAHALKGICLNLGANDAARACAAIEQFVDEEALLPQLMRSLEAALGRLLGFLRQQQT